MRFLSGARLPDSKHRDRWESFIDKTFDQGAGLLAPVYAVGLSGGGNVALRMAEKHPEVQGVVAMAPFVGGNPVKGLIFPMINLLSGTWSNARALQKCGGRDRSGWYHFPKEEGVPHAMLSPLENPVPGRGEDPGDDL